MTKRNLIGGIGLGAGLAGAGLMFILDPDRGRRRRAFAGDKLRRSGTLAQRFFGKTSRDISNRSRGLGATAASLVEDRSASPEILAERVRARIGRVCSHPGAIEVSALGRVVSLHGPVLEAEASDVISAARSVAGVERVEDRLERHEQPGNVPGLQHGPPRRPRETFELFQENWSPAARALMGLAGGVLAFYGTRAGNRPGAIADAAAALLLARAVSNRPMRRLFGLIGRGERQGREAARRMVPTSVPSEMEPIPSQT